MSVPRNASVRLVCAMCGEIPLFRSPDGELLCGTHEQRRIIREAATNKAGEVDEWEGGEVEPTGAADSPAYEPDSPPYRPTSPAYSPTSPPWEASSQVYQPTAPESTQ